MKLFTKSPSFLNDKVTKSYTNKNKTINEDLLLCKQSWPFDLQTSDASISLFQFRYEIDTIFTKYCGM